ncbi:MAG: CHAD domain-containing protein [Flavipsychrobacter sp.]|nr:CHAD domain-containing protein [Flavipsychrobacter sp.]
MQSAKIHKLLEKDVQKVAKAASCVAPNFKADDIHAFRVGIKKLRAFIYFINSVKGQPQLKLTKKIHRLYNIAGTLRDAHLKYETLTERELILPQYYANLSVVVLRNKAEWQKLYSKQIMKKLLEQMTDNLFVQLTPTDLANFYAQQVKRIKKINNDVPDDEHVHKMRKLIKHMVYITALAKKKWEGAEEVIACVPYGQLIDISNLVGNFNDGSILLYELSSFSSMGMQQQEAIAMARYVDEARARHKALRKDLLRQIGEFVDVVEERLA